MIVVFDGRAGRVVEAEAWPVIDVCVTGSYYDEKCKSRCERFEREAVRLSALELTAQRCVKAALVGQEGPLFPRDRYAVKAILKRGASIF